MVPTSGAGGHGSLSIRHKIWTRAPLLLVRSDESWTLICWSLKIHCDLDGVNLVLMFSSGGIWSQEKNEADKYWINLYYLKYIQDNTGINNNDRWRLKLEISNSVLNSSYLDRSDCVCLLDCKTLYFCVKYLKFKCSLMKFFTNFFSTKVRVQFAINHSHFQL